MDAPPPARVRPRHQAPSRSGSAHRPAGGSPRSRPSSGELGFGFAQRRKGRRIVCQPVLDGIEIGAFECAVQIERQQRFQLIAARQLFSGVVLMAIPFRSRRLLGRRRVSCGRRTCGSSPWRQESTGFRRSRSPTRLIVGEVDDGAVFFRQGVDHAPQARRPCRPS